MPDELASYRRACRELRRSVDMWQRKALELEHIALQRGDDEHQQFELRIRADIYRECAKELHAYLDWTTTPETEAVPGSDEEGER